MAIGEHILITNMKKIDFNGHIWEGWTVGDFISELEPQLDAIMGDEGWHPDFRSRDDLKCWCMDNQPYYKKYIPEVVNYFA